MSIEWVAAFLGVSLLMYCLLAGADFGAGILEVFRGSRYREEQEELITHAMGPVWEANHMWLVLAVVILFNGFPKAFSALCVTFHIPITLMLMGVILRGCAFTFRAYDAVKDGSRRVYGVIFRISSVLTPIMLGSIAGATLLGDIPAAAGASFTESYVFPWFNPFALSVGLLTAALFAFLASVYLIGESRSERLREVFHGRAHASCLAAVALGGVVFLTAQAQGLELFRAFISQPLSRACLILATLLLAPLWIALRRRWIVRSRIAAAAQFASVLLGWFGFQFPVLIASHHATVAGAAPTRSLTLYNAAADPSVLHALLGALGLGSALIFPALFFLFRVFKRSAA